MAYTASLTANQQLAIACRGTQTTISLVSTSPGQQQSQTNSFTTGSWQTAPKLYQLGTGFILEINGENGSYFISIQFNSISTVSAPDLNNATTVELNNSSDPVNTQKIEFEPMQPMKMGNMSMDINSMSMQMGNMSMNLGKIANSTKFCSQCGEKANKRDRFCSSCGHQLNN